MPPKKAPPKRGGSKGSKGKGKDVKGKKKGRKVNKKYAGLTFEGEFIAMKPRDQLEVIAETIRSQVECERGERIRIQLERDVFSELATIYMPKLKQFRLAHELNVCKLIRLKQDIEDQEGIKKQETKFYRYEGQLRLSSLQMKDHLRERRTKKKMQSSWRFSCLENDTITEFMENFPTKMKKLMEKTKIIRMEAVNKYKDMIDGNTQRYAIELKKTSDHLVRELLLYDYLEEIGVTEDAYDLMIERMNAYEWISIVAKSYYLQQVHNCLDAIVIMCDHWDDMDVEEKVYELLIERAEETLEETQIMLDDLNYSYTKAVSRHAGFLRLKKGLATTYRSLRLTERRISAAIQAYRDLINTAIKVDDDKADFRGGSDQVGANLWGGFLTRMDVEASENMLEESQQEAQAARDYQRSFFQTIEDADNDFYLHKAAVEEEQDITQTAKERSLQILKQHDDMFLAIRAQFARNEVAKHPLRYPITPIMIGQMRGLGHQPAGLVAGTTYKERPHTPPKPKKLPWCGEPGPLP